MAEQNPCNHRLVTKNSRNFTVAPGNYADFWDSLEKGEWEPDTFRIFDSFISTDTVFFDIGSWIGPTALYGAQTAARTHAFEPDPVAYAALAANVGANDNAPWRARLNVWNKAVALEAGTLRMGSKYKIGDSMSSALFCDENNSWEVEAIGFAKLVEEERSEGGTLFVKMDIEGGEFKLIPAIRETLTRHDMTLYLSTHPIFMAIEHFKNYRMDFVGRLICCWHQFKLVRSLPFKFIYYQDGKKLNLARDLMAIMLGKLPLFELVATNRQWNLPASEA